MKSIRILLACSFALFASAALVRAGEGCGKKDEAAATSADKTAGNKTEKEGCGGCTKSEKKDEKKA